MFDSETTSSVLDKLGTKVSALVSDLQEARREIELLSQDVVTLKAQNENYIAQIDKLESDNRAKDQEIEEIVNKIESILG